MNHCFPKKDYPSDYKCKVHGKKGLDKKTKIIFA